MNCEVTPTAAFHAVGVISQEGSFGGLHPHRTESKLNFHQPRVNHNGYTSASASTFLIKAKENELRFDRRFKQSFLALKKPSRFFVRADGKDHCTGISAFGEKQTLHLAETPPSDRHCRLALNP